MPTKYSPPTSFRFTPADKKILKALTAKLGIGPAQILRVAIRRLAEAEAVKQ